MKAPRVVLASVVGLGLATHPGSGQGVTVTQTVQFSQAAPELLYAMFLDPKEHAAASRLGPVDIDPRVGGRIAAFKLNREQCAAWTGCDWANGPTSLVQATILKLVPGREIVMSWKNLAWRQAVNAADVSDLESLVTLTFSKNAAGAQIEMVQANVPQYLVRLPDGEQGPLSALVNTHWNLVYWNAWQAYIATKGRSSTLVPENGAPVPRAGDVVKAFYAAVVARDFTTARSYLADDLVFKGLFETYHGIDAYLASLTKLMQVTVRLDVRKIISEGNEVAIFYELQTKAPVEGTVLVAERHEIRNGKISYVESAFDGRPYAAMFTPKK